MEIKNNKIKFSLVESLFTLAKEIDISKKIKEEVKNVFWFDEYKVRFGIFIPKVVRIGYFYKVNGTEFIYLIILIGVILLSLILLIFFLRPLEFLVTSLIIIFLAILFIKKYLDENFEKEFCYYTYKNKKVKIIYLENGNLKRVVIGVEK